MWWAALALAGEHTPDDPYRWLERRHSPEVRSWWAQQDEQARAWAGAEGRHTAVKRWVEAWNEAHPPEPMLADHRGGRSAWVENVPIESSGGKTRWEPHVFVEGRELDGLTDPLCAYPQLSPDGGAVVWGRFIPHDEGEHDEQPTLCALYALDLELDGGWGGERRELLSSERVSATWSRDSQSVIVVHRDGGRSVTSRFARQGGPGEELDRRRRWMQLSTAPTGELVGRSLFNARGKQRRPRFVVGEPGEMRWAGSPQPWYDEYPAVVGYREDELLLHSKRSRQGEAEIVRMDLDRPGSARWRTLVSNRPGMDFVSAALHHQELLVVWSRDGLQRLETQPWDGGPPVPVELPGGPWTNVRTMRSFDETMVILAQSPAAFSAWSRALDGTMTELPGGWRREGVVFEAVNVPTARGTVPVTLLRPEGSPSGPVWLYAYAGFGESVTSWWSSSAALWLAAGGTYAVAHARGGRERGADWHDGSHSADLGGRYDEVVEVAQWFVDDGRTTPGQIVLSGASNGGLTMAASVARRPELFGAGIGTAGVYDLVYAPRFGRWWPKEYGRAGDEEVWPVRMAESPVHRQPAGPLPPLLLVTGERDPVVDPAHTFKLGAAWSERPGGPVLVRVDRGTHMSSRDLRESTPVEVETERASTLAFAFHALGIEVPAPPSEGDLAAAGPK